VDDRAASLAPCSRFSPAQLLSWCTLRANCRRCCLRPSIFLALSYFYEWSRAGRWRALLKGVVLTLAAASAHHVTLIFGSVLFAAPVLWLAYSDARQEGSSTAAVFARAFTFVVLTCAGVGVVLLPYWIAILRHPIEQMPIPHGSR